MIQIRALLFSFSFFIVYTIKGQDFNWATGIGSQGAAGLGVTYAEDSDIDMEGNLYSIGHFTQGIDVDPSSGIQLFNTGASNKRHTFISKQNSDGELVWAVRLINDSAGYVRGHALDVSNGHVFITGIFSGVTDFDPGAGTFEVESISSHPSYFVLKIDTNAQFEWVRHFGNDHAVTEPDETGDIAVDSDGGVYVVGDFRDTIDIDPGAGVVNFVAPTPAFSSPKSDIFILKLDSAGNYQWARHYGNTVSEYLARVDVGPNDEVVLTGLFSGSVDFGWNQSQILSAGASAFVLKLDTAGGFQWVKNIPNGQHTRGVTVGDDGSIYNVGRFSQQINMNAGSAGILNPGTAAYVSVYTIKLDSSGNFQWINGAGGPAQFEIRDVDVNSVGEVFTTGDFYGTNSINFSLKGSAQMQNGIGNRNSFVQKLYTNGNYAWSHVLSSTNGNCRGYAINVNDSGDIYGSGRYLNQVNMNPTLDTTYVGFTSGANQHHGAYVFLWYDCPVYFLNSDTTVCDSFISPSGTVIYETGVFTDTLTNSVGCDSIVTYEVLVNNSSLDIDTVYACNSYTWIDSITYSQSNDSAYVTYNSIAGCDSVVRLHLTLGHSDTANDVITACDSYTWIDGNTYTASNTVATHYLTNTSNCDSIVQLDLTINTTQAGLTILDTIIVADSVNGTYQWLSCDSGYHIISGEIYQVFEPIHSGFYAVYVTEFGCIDTSACIYFEVDTTTGRADQVQLENIEIFPNPTRHSVNIRFNSQKPMHFRLLNSMGMLLKEEYGTSPISFQLPPVSGVYYIEAIGPDQSTVNKVVKI